METTNYPWVGRPNEKHAPAYATTYFQLTAGEKDLIKSLESELLKTVDFIQKIEPEKLNYRYAESKWSVKGVFSHIIETERILQYRALRFSRMDSKPLEGFDENLFVQNNNHKNCTLTNLVEEFATVRKSSILLFQGMTHEMFDFIGNANGVENTARNIGWFMVGHSMHHIQVIRERYLF